MNPYQKPELTVIGTLHDLTQAGKGKFNKVGYSPDIYSNSTPIVGSIVPVR